MIGESTTLSVQASLSSSNNLSSNDSDMRRHRETAQQKLSVAATTAMIASLSNPLIAEAAVTPSLKNTLLSIVAGGAVLGAIAAAVIGVSSFDKVSRK